MAHDMLLPACIVPNHTFVAHKEKAMIALTLFFVAGILLGFIGLRLLSRWETPTDKRPTIFRHHS
jgi:hypothetical protein